MPQNFDNLAIDVIDHRSINLTNDHKLYLIEYKPMKFIEYKICRNISLNKRAISFKPYETEPPHNSDLPLASDLITDRMEPEFSIAIGNLAQPSLRTPGCSRSID